MANTITVDDVATMLSGLGESFAKAFGLDPKKVDRYLDGVCQQKIGPSTDPQPLIDLFNQLNKEYLDNEYKLAWNNNESRFGKCDYKNKTIYLSRVNHKVYGTEEMLETIRHEVAHACDYKYNGWCSMHGNPWKVWAVKLGANPRASKVLQSTKQINSGWVLRHIDTGEVYRGYARRPKRVGKLETSWLPGKKRETLGRLEIVWIK